MQYDSVDYYEEQEGCCLHCPNSYDGCLCYECKCTKCYWYLSPEESGGDKGGCEKTDELKKERKEEMRNHYEKLNEENYQKYKKLKEENYVKEDLIKNKGKIPSEYSCQKCFRYFITEKNLKIEKDVKPLCNDCGGLIK